MNYLEEHVNTQYGDYRGIVSVDTHSGSELFKLCADFGIDTKKNFPVGFKIDEETFSGIGENDEGLYVTVFTVDIELLGNHDTIESEILKNGGRLIVRENELTIPYEYLGKYFKRLQLLVINDFKSKVKKLEIKD
jgi:hypothetical protein